MTEQPAEDTSHDVPDPPPWATLPRPKRTQHRTALEFVCEANFPLAIRGYDRAAVDRYVAEVTRLVDQLEATQLRRTVVQRALEEVGEQTSEILRQAHETAEEVTARSRAQSEGRLQRAELEAAEIRREAEEAAARLESENAGLWEERQRLIQDIRALAQDVLAVSEDADARLAPPSGLERAEPSEPESPSHDDGQEAAVAIDEDDGPQRPR